MCPAVHKVVVTVWCLVKFQYHRSLCHWCQVAPTFLFLFLFKNHKINFIVFIFSIYLSMFQSSVNLISNSVCHLITFTNLSFGFFVKLLFFQVIHWMCQSYTHTLEAKKISSIKFNVSIACLFTLSSSSFPLCFLVWLNIILHECVQRREKNEICRLCAPCMCTTIIICYYHSRLSSFELLLLINKGFTFTRVCVLSFSN